MPYRDPEAKRNRDNASVLAASRNVRDIAPGYPDPGDLATRSACEYDLRRFLETYFPAAFSLRWSPDHLRAIERLHQVAVEGGLFAFAMPRGGGKTSLSIRAAIWALLYRHRRFVCLVGATESLAGDLLKHIKMELTTNARLVRDFRQVCYPLVRLENNARKRIGQLFNGQQTRIEWTADRLAFPCLPPEALDGPDVGGSIVTVASITGAIRGQSTTLGDGTIVRPELVILDDPSTRESASSSKQNADRAAIIRGDVLGMAGPEKRIAAMMPCTVVQEGDLAVEFLDRKKSPEWSGQRTKMVYSFPTNESRWNEYREILTDADRGMVEATAFYAANREAMDAGAEVAWPERMRPGELSAIQHAMNLRFEVKDPAFFAEYQNEPLPQESATGLELVSDQLVSKLNRVPRGVVPQDCTLVSGMIDVQLDALFYCVTAWDSSFGGGVIDYGVFPDPKRSYFSLRDLKGSLSKLYPSAGPEGRIYAALGALTDQLASRDWERQDGTVMRLERLLIDSGNWTDLILKFCRESRHSGILTPSKGMGLRPGDKPFSEYRRDPGDRAGCHWRIPAGPGRGAVRVVQMDVNYWKSFLRDRFTVMPGDRGCLSLFGEKADRHHLFADHLTSESCDVQTSEKTGRRSDVWRLRPNRENHWLDAAVGSAVAASMQGISLAETDSGSVAMKRKRVSFKELADRRKRGAAP